MLITTGLRTKPEDYWFVEGGGEFPSVLPLPDECSESPSSGGKTEYSSPLIAGVLLVNDYEKSLHISVMESKGAVAVAFPGYKCGIKVLAKSSINGTLGCNAAPYP